MFQSYQRQLTQLSMGTVDTLCPQNASNFDRQLLGRCPSADAIGPKPTEQNYLEIADMTLIRVLRDPQALRG